MKHVVQMTSGGIIYIRRFMTIDSDTSVLLSLLTQHFEGLQCFYYSWERFMEHAVEMSSDGTIYVPVFLKKAQAFEKH
jgi:hypothetical protein